MSDDSRDRASGEPIENLPAPDADSAAGVKGGAPIYMETPTPDSVGFQDASQFKSITDGTSNTAGIGLLTPAAKHPGGVN